MKCFIMRITEGGRGPVWRTDRSHAVVLSRITREEKLLQPFLNPLNEVGTCGLLVPSDITTARRQRLYRNILTKADL